MFGDLSSDIKPGTELPDQLKINLYQQHLSTHFELHCFKTQVVAGINYYIKYQVDQQYLLAKVFMNTDGNYQFIKSKKINNKEEIHFF